MSSTVRHVSGDSVEKITSDVYASRRFQLTVTSHGYELVGASFKQPIVEGINVAQCGRWNHHAPNPYCTCGFYAYDNTKSRFPMFGATVNAVAVDAVVRLSGKVIVADQGLRAERMEIVAVSSPRAQVREKLQSFLSVATFANRDEMLTEYPITEFERTKSTLTQATTWAVKKFMMEARNWVRDCGPSFIAKAIVWAFMLATGIFAMKVQADLLPEGYKSYSALLVAIQFIALWIMLKLPWPITLLLSFGLALASNDLLSRFREPLEAVGLLEPVAGNCLFLFVGGFTVLAVRLLRPTFIGSPQVQASIQHDGKMPVLTYLPEGDSKNG